VYMCVCVCVCVFIAIYLFIVVYQWLFIHLHLHLGNLADAFIQSELQRVLLLKERQQYIAVVPKDRNRAVFDYSYL